MKNIIFQRKRKIASKIFRNVSEKLQGFPPSLGYEKDFIIGRADSIYTAGYFKEFPNIQYYFSISAQEHFPKACYIEDLKLYAKLQIYYYKTGNWGKDPLISLYEGDNLSLDTDFIGIVKNLLESKKDELTQINNSIQTHINRRKIKSEEKWRQYQKRAKAEFKSTKYRSINQIKKMIIEAMNDRIGCTDEICYICEKEIYGNKFKELYGVDLAEGGKDEWDENKFMKYYKRYINNKQSIEELEEDFQWVYNYGEFIVPSQGNKTISLQQFINKTKK